MNHYMHNCAVPIRICRCGARHLLHGPLLDLLQLLACAVGKTTCINIYTYIYIYIHVCSFI